MSKYKVNTTTNTKGISLIQREAAVKAPTVWVTPQVRAEMDLVISHCQKEVGWMCLVENPEEGHFVITDIYIPKQTVHAAETDIDESAMQELALSLISQDIDTDKLYAWFHSHVNMGVSPSGQDERQVEEFLEGCPVFIRGIMNKRGEFKVDVYYRDHNVAFTNVDFKVLYAIPAEREEEILRTIKDNVKEITYHSNYSGHGGFHGGKKNVYPLHQNHPSRGANYASHGTNHASRAVGPSGPAVDFDTLLDSEDLDDFDLLDDRALNSFGNDFRANPNFWLTGYGEEWDETTPHEQRPDNWWLDPEYQDRGWAKDSAVR